VHRPPKICNNNNNNNNHTRVIVAHSTCHAGRLQRRPKWDLNMAHNASVGRRGRPSSSSRSRRQVLSSAYVVQIDSSRESLYLMRLPNGVRLKRCSHHRRNPPPRRLQPSSIFVRLVTTGAGPDEEML